ncbi:PTS fructose transporter subunit IIABC [Jeotgalibacillus haloalkalitolerans]|uniref:Fructose-specific PTS transporter subunit EIIC n=1 Tax=Jeotgalibacillus haloalkalitolerans TaxID=3104292 RepID=A0ABU5KIW4_9BACL|nr:fructose-specific PTS transporter subunit EIIC [Jeotgalibacillus sp. HH7-29]MDZ5711171.1 fructose-specific PTS transporter subunit EIIC [Jeotgalibacillus sp. HH7-29]
MKITDLLTKSTINLELKSTEKQGTIDEMVSLLDRAGKLADAKAYREAIQAREDQTTTGIGEGVAIPHAKTKAVKEPAIAFGRSVEGLDYESLDGQPAHLVFMIAATEGANDTHLQALSRLSVLLLKDEVKQGLLDAKTPDDVIALISSFEEEEAEEEQTTGEVQGQILAVTGCPTGIAHTYMAADALKNKAKEMNVPIKVETNGSDGAKNVLTAEEIENAVAIIVAADTKVEMERFKGKRVIEVPVTDGIRKTETLINRAIKQDAPVYQGSGGSEKREEGQAKGRSGVYKHLMNGVSNMLPFIVGGGILIALSFMFEDQITGERSALGDILSYIGGENAFALIIPVLAAFIAMSIADRPGFAPGMVGGLMAASSNAGFLGGIIAGFLAGYLVLGLKRVFANLPQVFNGLKPVLIYPLFGILITGLIMYWAVQPLSAINQGVIDWLGGLGTGNLALLGLLLGGMMAIDMGGPINKAAYAFALAVAADGQFGPQAAVMAGGMVPPLGMALATTLFRKKFNEQERKTGVSAYFLGAFFITEGAIPFAAADPLRVIPAAVAGSAVAGGLTLWFDLALRAPHGGIFVFPTLEGAVINILLYVIAIVAGTVVTALTVGFLKKPVVA